MPVTIYKKNPEAKVSATSKTGINKEANIPLPAVLINSGLHATVGFATRFTKNLGNYESLQLSVSLYMPVEIAPVEEAQPTTSAVNVKRIDKTLDDVVAWVDLKMNKLLSDLDNPTEGNTKTSVESLIATAIAGIN